MDQTKTGSDRGDRLQDRQSQRKHHREKVSGFVGNIADGPRVIDGIVENVSVGGFEIVDLPQSFSGTGNTYTAVLSGGGKHYKVLTRPCWRRKTGSNNIHIGFKILDAPWEWLAFTMHDTPKRREH